MVKVKFTLQEPPCPTGGVEVQLCSFLNLATKWGCVVNAMPWPLYPGGRDPEPIAQEAQGWSGQVWKISPLVGFHLQTIQPVTSHYTGYIILAHTHCHKNCKFHGQGNSCLLVVSYFVAIAAEKVEDVREVLDYYQQFSNPVEAFRENQRKLLVSSQLAANSDLETYPTL